MKFAHLADLHLGYEQYNQSWRAEDFAEAFRNAARTIVSEAVDFVIIAGDLFHRSVPNPRTIKEAIEILSIFKRAKIPVFAIEGNHDKSIRDISAYHLLEALGLLNVLGFRKRKVEGENVVSERIENVYLVKGIVDGVEIVGDRHRTRWQLERILPFLKPESDECVLVLHQAVKEVVDINLEMAYDLTLSDLPKASYYAFGHIHIHTIYKFGDSYIAYPGSLERYDLREASHNISYIDEIITKPGIEKGFIIVEDFVPRFVKINVRDLISVNLRADSRDEMEKKFLKILDLINGDPVVIAKLSCTEEIDVKKFSGLLAKKAKYSEVRFERIREDIEKISVSSEQEFFNEFELKLLELLKEDSDIHRNTAYELIKEHFGLSKVRRIQDFEYGKAEESSVENNEKRSEGKKEEAKVKKEIKKKKPTLLDFFG